MKRRAVLLMAYGGPDSLADVELYLRDVRGGRPVTPEIVESTRRRYERIGGCSPLLEITRGQAKALETALNEPDLRVYVGMRHWKPYTGETLRQIAGDGITNVLALCMAPHGSSMSSGAYLEKLQAAQRVLAEEGQQIEIDFVPFWHDHPLLIQALAEKLAAALEHIPSGERDGLHVLFTAHSLPAARLSADDPYAAQVEETARLVAEAVRLPKNCWQVCYQSVPHGASGWLGPNIEEVIPALADGGAKHILVAPVGFLADHVEILYDLDIECRELAEAHGAQFWRTEMLNSSPLLISALKEIVLERTS